MIKDKISGIFLVAGTSIGGAMLALPMTAAKIGLVVASLYLMLFAIVMAGAAFLLIPLYEKNMPLSIASLAKNRLGKNWSFLASIALFMLLYSLLVAYLSGLSETLTSLTRLPETASLLLVTFILFISLALSDQIINFYNKIAFSVKVLILLSLFILLASAFRVSMFEANLLGSNHSFLVTLPIFVTSFGFHGSCPFLYKKFGKEKYKTSVIFGTIITLFIYLAWIFLIFGLLPREKISTSSLEAFLSLLTSFNPLLLIGFKIFYNLAIITSLFGVSLGLLDFLKEKLQSNNRFLLSGLVFFLPMLFTFLNSNLFLQALAFAGIALAFLALFLPSLLAWKDHLSHKLILGFLMIFACLISLGELLSFLSF